MFECTVTFQTPDRTIPTSKPLNDLAVGLHVDDRILAKGKRFAPKARVMERAF